MPRKTKKSEAEQKPAVTALVLRTCNADMTSYGGFVWPESGPVEAPDWSSAPVCGYGLHGMLWGEGNVARYCDLSKDSRWLVVAVDEATIVEIDGKVKYPRGEVVFCGDRYGAAKYIAEHGGAQKRCAYGTATAGDGGTATAGYGGTATAGDGGTATAGVCGTATAGDGGTATAGDGGTATAGYGGTATAGVCGTATAGYGGTATAGYGGTVAITYWNGKRYKCRIAQVRDEDGDGELEPNVNYRLNINGAFEKVEG